MATSLDHALRQEMETYVEQLTHSGKPTLDVDSMKKFKKICKKSDEYVKHAFHLLMSELEKNHSEIRLSAFQMTSELFHRSHCFRELILADLQYIIELTIETNPDFPLPPPTAAAKKLKCEALQALQQWHDKFGDTYKKLSLGYNYLKNCKKVDFQDMQARTVAERRRSEDENRRKNVLKQEKLNNTMAEMTEGKVDIQLLMTQIENCLRLILPDPESFHLPGLKSPDPHCGDAPLLSQTGFAEPGPSHVVEQEIFPKTFPVKEESPESCNDGRMDNLPDSQIPATCTETKVTSDSPTDESQPILCSLCGQEKNQRKSPKKGTKVKSSKHKYNEAMKFCPRCGCVLPTDFSLLQDRKPTDPAFVMLDANAIVSSTSLSAANKISNNSSGPPQNIVSVKQEVTTELDKKQDHPWHGQDDIQSLDSSNFAKPQPEDNKNVISGRRLSLESSAKRHNKTHVHVDHIPTTTNVTTLAHTGTVGTRNGSKTHPNRLSSVESVKTEDEDDDFEEMSDDGLGEHGEEDTEISNEDLMRGHGIGSKTYQLSIELVPGVVNIQETVDNADILYNLKDLVGLLSNKFLPMVQRWLEVFTKTGADQTIIRRVLAMKEALQQTKDKVSQLRISRLRKTLTEKQKADQDDDSDDDNFEDVPEKEGYEPNIPDHLREEYGLVPRAPQQPTARDWMLPKGKSTEEETDPTSSKATLMKMVEKLKKEGADSKMAELDPSLSIAALSGIKPKKDHEDSKLLKVAPIVPFGLDLFHWGEDKVEIPLVVRYDTEHRFWTPRESGDVVDKAAVESMHSRVINYTGKFEPVQRACKAPLANGKLCPRRDRVKCPFHGRIIERNNMGQPLNTDDALRLIKEKEKKQQDTVPEWEDPALQAEIKAATGIDLSRNKTKGRKRKFPGLTDLRKKPNPVTNRLEKKIFNTRTMKRVTVAMDSIAAKRIKDKFGNNFNYAFPNR